MPRKTCVWNVLRRPKLFDCARPEAMLYCRSIEAESLEECQFIWALSTQDVKHGFLNMGESLIKLPLRSLFPRAAMV